MFAETVRHLRSPHWIALFALVLFSWAVLYVSSVPADLRAAGRVFGADFLSSLCVVTPDAAGFLRMTAMWGLMSMAMMLPTAVHAFATYEDLGQAVSTDFARLVAGFLAVWAGFSLAASAAQIALFDVGLLSPFGEIRSTGLSAAVLIAAGLYQFTQLKSSCLAKCRTPLMFFMAHWQEGPWRNGLRLGAVCLGCCWALMALAFVGGAMSLAFMGLATFLMVVEKLPTLGRHVTGPLGIALIATGTFVAINAL